jgi:hypothetical protein
MVLLVVRSLRRSRRMRLVMVRCLVRLGRVVVRGSASSRILAGSLRLVRGTMADKLHPAEAAAREAHAAGLEERANVDGLEPDLARAIRSRATAIRQAMPLLQFKRATAAHEAALASGPSTGLEATDFQAGVREAQAKLKADHPYPPDLEYAVDAALKHGRSPDDIDLYEVTGFPNPDAVKAKPKRLTHDQQVAKATAEVNRRMASLGKRLDDIREDLDAWKVEQTRLGARFSL